jgi:hypothetical protein
MAQCGFIINRRFGGKCRLHLQVRNKASEESVKRVAKRLTTAQRVRTVGRGGGRGMGVICSRSANCGQSASLRGVAFISG